MHKIRVITNESFDNYIDFLNNYKKHNLLKRKFEGRYDTLDLDDFTSSISAPTDSEIDNSVRELDLVDTVAAKANVVPEISSNGVRWLDLDDGKQISDDEVDDKIRELDFDDKPKNKIKSNSDDEVDDKIRELDLDDKGNTTSSRPSSIGLIGSLDIDGDIDTSNIAASLDDVYTCLSSNDVRVIKSTIKRYASDITDKDKIRDAMLVHATNLNLNCLRVMCGDMRIMITAHEKQLGFINAADIKDALARLKSIASKLTGSNNTLGLIPNAIVSCVPNNQLECINVVDFLKIWCDLPIMPLYFRGALIRRNYDLASYLFTEIEGKIPNDIITGTKGLANRLKQLDDIPKALLRDIITSIANNDDVSSNVIGDLAIVLLNNGDKQFAKKLLSQFSGNKITFIKDYIDDNDAQASQLLASI